MEDTYLLYLPAAQSEYVTVLELIITMIIYRVKIHTHIHTIEYEGISERDGFSHIIYIYIRHSTSGLGACSTITEHEDNVYFLKSPI